MKKSIESIDLLRGICLLLMVFINFYDEIVKVSILESRQGIFIDFLVTSMVPNVFITLMGFLLIINDDYKAKHIFKKAIKILLIGFVINFIRIPLPELIGNLFGITQYGDLWNNSIYHLGMIDIYSFVGYSLLTIIPLTCMRLNYFAYILLSALIMFLTSFKQEMLDLVPAYLKFVFSYIFIGEPGNVYFPIFPWLAYLLLGTGLGLFYLQHGRKLFYKGLAWMGTICLCIGYPILRMNYQENFSMHNDFYKHDYTVGIFLFGMTMFLIFCAEKILPRLPLIFKSGLKFTSRRIIKMYFCSWLFTGWFITLRGMNNDFSILDSIIGSMVIYLLSFTCVFLLEKFKSQQVKSF